MISSNANECLGRLHDSQAVALGADVDVAVGVEGDGVGLVGGQRAL